MHASDYIVHFLKAVGVRRVFGYPGTPILPFMAALERQSDMNQARLTGEPIVCKTTLYL